MVLKLAKINKHKRDRYVREHPDYANNHIYLINGKSHIERGYKSVTTFIKKFFEEFDANEIIDKYYDKWQDNKHVDYFGKTKQEIIAMWNKKRDDAASAGTFMHKQFENYANYNANIEMIDEFPEFEKWFEKEITLPYRTEMTVYHPKYKIVGNIDFIAYDNDGELIIVDYKRTELPNTSTFGRVCKPPLDLPHNDYSKHALQLNIYKKILEDLYDVKISKLYNLYIKGTEKPIFVRQPIIENIDEIMKCKDL